MVATSKEPAYAGHLLAHSFASISKKHVSPPEPTRANPEGACCRKDSIPVGANLKRHYSIQVHQKHDEESDPANGFRPCAAASSASSETLYVSIASSACSMTSVGLLLEELSIGTVLCARRPIRPVLN